METFVQQVKRNGGSWGGPLWILCTSFVLGIKLVRVLVDCIYFMGVLVGLECCWPQSNYTLYPVSVARSPVYLTCTWFIKPRPFHFNWDQRWIHIDIGCSIMCIQWRIVNGLDGLLWLMLLVLMGTWARHLWALGEATLSCPLSSPPA